MTANQTTCGRFFSYQNGCIKKKLNGNSSLKLTLSLNSINILKYPFFVILARQLKSQNYVIKEQVNTDYQEFSEL
jgi:hypothetical protein